MGNVSWIMTIATGIYLSAGLAGAAESDLTKWDQWRNSLKPEGQVSTEVTLSVAGATDYSIVIPDVATTQEKKAAADLAHWLQEMTGAEFPVVLDSQVKASEKIISIGRTRQFLEANLAESKTDLKDEG